MKTWKTRISVTLILAAAVHFIVVLAIPHVISGELERGILETARINTLRHDNPRSHGPENRIPQSNPDFLPSILAYDVSEKPLRFHLAWPGYVPYWSFSLFASNIDNYYVLNYRDIDKRESVYDITEVKLVLVGPQGSYQAKDDEVVVTSPTNKGFGLIRMIVSDRYSERGLKEVKELKKVQLMSYVEPIP